MRARLRKKRTRLFIAAAAVVVGGSIVMAIQPSASAQDYDPYSICGYYTDAIGDAYNQGRYQDALDLQAEMSGYGCYAA